MHQIQYMPVFPLENNNQHTSYGIFPINEYLPRSWIPIAHTKISDHTEKKEWLESFRLEIYGDISFRTFDYTDLFDRTDRSEHRIRII